MLVHEHSRSYQKTAAMAAPKPQRARQAVLVLLLATIGWLAGAPRASAQQNAQCDQTPLDSLINSNGPTTPDNAYHVIKSLEGCFQAAAPSLTATVGRFDASTGQFTYASGTVTTSQAIQVTEQPESDPKLGPRLKPRTFMEQRPIVALSVNAVNVNLSFESTSAAPIQVAVKQMPADWTKCPDRNSCAALATTASPGDWNSSGQSKATVSVGTAHDVLFSVTSAGKSFTGILRIVRPPRIGVGAFIIPVIPIEILYAPPPPATSSTTLTGTSTTTFKTQVQYDNSSAHPLNPEFASPADLFTTVTSVLKPFLGPAASAPVDLMNKLVTGLNGKLSQTSTQGTSASSTHSLTISDSNSDKESTGGTLGPGLDDVFIFYSNVKVMWVSHDGQVQLSVLGYDFNRKSGDFLLQNKDNPRPFQCLNNDPTHCLTADTVKTMLRLDPFTAPLVNQRYTPGQAIALPASLPADRFDCASDGIHDIGQSDGSDAITYKHVVTVQDDTVNATFTSTVTDEKAADLAFLLPQDTPGAQTQNTTAKTTNTQSSSFKVDSEIDLQVTYNLYNKTPYVVQQCYDRVFSTLAFLPVPVSAQPVFSGQALSSLGLPLANTMAVLQAGSAKFITHTDSTGHYAFHAATIPAGAAVLTVDNNRKAVQIAAHLNPRGIAVPPPTDRVAPAPAQGAGVPAAPGKGIAVPPPPGKSAVTPPPGKGGK